MKNINNKCFLSIIIPVYNCDKYIEKCICSVLKQGIKKYEIIIVNDGSTDNTASVLEKYKKNKNIRVININNNSGVSTARNVGIENATGEYITFIDADDYIDGNLYSRVEEFISNFDEKVDLIKIPITFVYPNGIKKSKKIFIEPIKYFKKEQYKDTVYNFYLNGYSLSNAVCFFFKRELVNDIRFTENINYGEDLLFCFECIKKSKSIVFLNCKEKYNYYIREDSSSRIKNKEKLYKNFSDAQKVYKEIYIGLYNENYNQKEKIKVRFLHEMEITLRKLTMVCKLKEFLNIYKELCEDEFFKQCLLYYKQMNLLYERKMFMLYKIDVSTYYFVERIHERIKFFIKKLY